MSTIGNQNKHEIDGHALALQAVDLPVSAVIRRLHGFLSTNTFSTLRGPDEVAYQVPASKVLEIYAVEAGSNSNNLSGRILYGDTSPGVSGAAPTNPIYYGTGTSSSVDCMQTTSTDNYTTRRAIYFRVPASKYPIFANGNPGANAWISVLAVERDA